MGYVKSKEEVLSVINECLEQKSGEEIAEFYMKVTGAAAVYDGLEDHFLCSKVRYLWEEVKKFSESEKSFAASVINRSGAEQHPVATKENLSMYGRNFLIECIEKALSHWPRKVSMDGAIAGKGILKKLGVEIKGGEGSEA